MTGGPWDAFEPSAADRWDIAKVAHLHRRAGFAARWSELERDVRAGPDTSVARLLKPPPATPDEAQLIAGLRQGVIDANDAERLKAWWLYRMLFGADPLREKLTLFWHSHFATSNSKVKDVGLMVEQNELLRRLALGRFADLLLGITNDKAMLIWLDGAPQRPSMSDDAVPVNKKERPNENYAREFLELFTLGPGRYTENDIREAARAFAGWWRRYNTATSGWDFNLDAAECDNGVKTFLGRTGPWQRTDIVRIALEKPAAADFLCRKLYRFFVSETNDPPADLIQPLSQEFRSHDFSVAHVVGTILRSRHFYSPGVRGERLKGPVEFGVGTLRMLDVPRANVRLLAVAGACGRQGQDLFYPPNVKGWEGGRTWITSTALLDRGNRTSDMIWGNADLDAAPLDPLAWAEANKVAPERVVDAWIDLLLPVAVPPAVRSLIGRTGRAGDADSLRASLQLILGCPQFQLA